jgi:hypothetical protein
VPAARSGATAGAYVVGLTDLRRALQSMEGEWPRALTRVHREIAKRAERAARAEASRMGGVQAKAAGAIKGTGTGREARIQVKPGARTRMANVAFWGAKRRTGWAARERYARARRQHPSWVGNTWGVAERGEGPYAINDALADELPEILREYELMLERLVQQAFPD